MKKLFVTAALVFGILIAQVSQANAQDVYVGTYSSGYKVYLMTETIRIESRQYMDYSCRVKAIRGNDVIYVDYTFWEDRQRSVVEHYRDSSGNTGMFTLSDANGHPVPYNIDNYIGDHYYQ